MLLESSWLFLELNLASKMDPKSTFFRVQEATYVKTRENPKLGERSTLGAHFCFPRASQNPPKIDEQIDVKIGAEKVMKIDGNSMRQ